MADFTALKTAIQNAIKQNGNEEITGNILQDVLLAIVSTLGDGSINDLITALGSEATTRGNADATLQQNINAEAQARQLADSTLQGGINTVSAAITAINNAIGNGCVYAGIATPSSTPASGKVFYLALTAGTYTNYGGLEVPQGINILKNNGSTWSLDSFLGIDDAPTSSSNNLVKSGGVFNDIMTNGSAFDLSAYNNGTTYADLNAALTALNALPAAYKKGGMSMKFVQTSDNNYVQYRCIADEFTTDTTKWSICVDEFLSENAKYIKKEIDSEGKLVFGITQEGDFVFGGGVPTQIKDFVQWALASKVNYKKGKGLINSFFASLLSIEESNDYLEMDKDAEGKMYHSVNAKGESYFSKLISPTIDEIRDKFKSTIEVLVEEATSFPTTKWLPILKNFKRTKVVNGVPTTEEATVSLAWISDVHNEPSVMERFLRFVAKYNAYLDDAIFTGDIVSDRWTDDISAMTSLIGYDKVLIALGNHDLTGYNGEYGPTNVPPLEAYNRYMKPWSGCIFPENASTYGYSYYYKDYSLAKLRLVVIDCMTYDTTQNTWFTSVLEDARTNNLHVIVASHVPAGGCANGFDTPFNSFDNSKLSGESLDTLYLTAVDSFIDNGGIFVCWMFGHVHTDFCGVMSSHPKQLFFIIGGGLTNRTLWQDTDRIENTNTIDQFNVISIDTDKKFIRIARVGADYDRQGRHRGIIVVSYAPDNLRVISEN